MKVIVTGAASFLGAAVVRHLLDDMSETHHICAILHPGSKHTESFKEMLRSNYADALAPSYIDRAVDKVISGGREEKSKGDDEGKRRYSSIELLELDLEDITRLPQILADEGPWDAFLHAAWEGPGSDNRANEEIQERNVALTERALYAASRLGCKRFVFTGSQAEYGPHKGRVSEDTPCDPVSAYGKAKAAVAKKSEEFCSRRSMDYIHARLFSVYGPGDHESSLISSCLDAWKDGRSIELGPCTQKWNYLYISDAAAALTALLKEGKAGIYNVAGDDTRPLSRYVKEMASICNAEGLYTFGARAQNAEGSADLNPSIRKIKRDTSWRPVTPFRDGISAMWRAELEK